MKMKNELSNLSDIDILRSNHSVVPNKYKTVLWIKSSRIVLSNDHQVKIRSKFTDDI